MDDATALNATLQRQTPALARCLSPLGRRAIFPRGIPFQASAAKSTEINATIGQLTDGRGGPMPLHALARYVPDLDPRSAFLYAPVDGPVSLREKWLQRQRQLAGQPTFQPALPVVTHGLTHGLSILAALFADAETEVVMPGPSWENYDLIFQLHAQARLRTYPFFHEGRFNVQGLADALSKVQRKAIIVLNFPGNPTGYTPTRAEAEQITQVLTEWEGPGVVIVDDAYQGWVYEDGLMPRSLFWGLAERADPERLVPFKIDGATKELAFFSSRVGFLTHGATGTAADALLSKIKCVIRSTVGCASGPAMAMVDAALDSPDLEAAFAERRGTLGRRYQALREALDAHASPRMVPYPFNSAFFALLQLDPSLDAHAVRERLIQEHSVGTIAFPEQNALRVAYCSIHEDAIPALVERISKTVQGA